MTFVYNYEIPMITLHIMFLLLLQITHHHFITSTPFLVVNFLNAVYVVQHIHPISATRLRHDNVHCMMVYKHTRTRAHARARTLHTVTWVSLL